MLPMAPMRGAYTLYRSMICRNPYSVLHINSTRLLSSTSPHDKEDTGAFRRPDTAQFRVRKAPGEDIVAYWRTLPIGMHWEAMEFWSGKGRGIKQNKSRPGPETPSTSHAYVAELTPPTPQEGLRAIMRRIQYPEDFKFARESIKLLRRKNLNVEPRTLEVFLETAAEHDAVEGASFLANCAELPWRESRNVQSKFIQRVLEELVRIQSVTGRSYAIELAGILRRGIKPRPTLQLNAACVKIIIKGLADSGQHWLVLLAAKELEHDFGTPLSAEERKIVDQSKEFEAQRLSSSIDE